MVAAPKLGPGGVVAKRSHTPPAVSTRALVAPIPPPASPWPSISDPSGSGPSCDPVPLLDVRQLPGVGWGFRSSLWQWPLQPTFGTIPTQTAWTPPAVEEAVLTNAPMLFIPPQTTAQGHSSACLETI